MIDGLALWHPFFSVQAGLSGSLIGLLFVSMSISHVKILAIPRLISYSLSSIIILGLALGVALCALAPQPSFNVFAVEIIVLTGIAATLTAIVQRETWRIVEALYRTRAILLNIFVAIVLLLQVSLAVAVWFVGLPGLSIALPVSILSFVSAILHAWIVVVEVHR